MYTSTHWLLLVWATSPYTKWQPCHDTLELIGTTLELLLESDGTLPGGILRRSYPHENLKSSGTD